MGKWQIFSHIAQTQFKSKTQLCEEYAGCLATAFSKKLFTEFKAACDLGLALSLQFRCLHWQLDGYGQKTNARMREAGRSKKKTTKKTGEWPRKGEWWGEGLGLPQAVCSLEYLVLKEYLYTLPGCGYTLDGCPYKQIVKEDAFYNVIWFQQMDFLKPKI